MSPVGDVDGRPRQSTLHTMSVMEDIERQLRGLSPAARKRVLQRLLADAAARKAELDAEVERLNGEIADLTDKRADLDRQIADAEGGPA